MSAVHAPTTSLFSLLRLGLLALGLLVVLAAAGALWGYGGRLAAWEEVGLWTALALLAPALLYRLSGRSLFGPILFYDLLRSARHGRHVLFRCFYLAALLVMLFLLYASWFRSGTSLTGGSLASAPATTVAAGERKLTPAEVAQFAAEFFETFIGVQFVVLVLLTPGCTAGAIAEEKERRTLDYLLATDLRPHEIVLGKLVSRLAYLTLLLLTGLPVLGFLQFLGGVDPQLVLAGFAATGLAMLSLASLSILNSVIVAKPRTAILLTYIEAALYLVVSRVLWEMSPANALVSGLNTGNILTALSRLREAAQMAAFASPVAPTVTTTVGGMTTVLPRLLLEYTLFHLGVTVVCVLPATVGLRAWCRWQASRRSRRSFAITFMPRRRPRVRKSPMLWKELYAEPLFRFGRISMAVVGALLYGLVILGAFVFLCLFAIGMTLGNLEEAMNEGVRWLGTPVACVMLLGVALRAASSLSAERDRQTFDSLLASPLTSEAILRAKWLGSLLCVRRLWWFLGAMWLAGLLTGGLHPLAAPLLIGAWFVYAAFLASLGLMFSLVCKNTMRATLWTLVTMLGLTGGHWLCGLCYVPLAAPPPTSRSETNWLLEFQKFGMTPPLTLNLLAFGGRDLRAFEHEKYYGYGRENYYTYYDDYSNRYYNRPVTCGRLLAAGASLGAYALAAWVPWAIARENFPRKTGRLPLPPHVAQAEYRSRVRVKRDAPEGIGNRREAGA